MSNFAILRTKKLKSFTKISMAAKHNSREAHAENADPDGQHELLAGSNNPGQRLTELLEKGGIKPRKNAVLAIEYVVTFSPEMKNKIDVKEWAEANLKFMKQEHKPGSILQAELHLDESTPHIHFVIVPLIKKEVRGKEQWRLSARDYLGGRDKMLGLQDRYAKAMQPFGLERGIRGSKSHHKEVKKYYGELNAEITKVDAEYKKMMLEMPESPGLFNVKRVLKQVKSLMKNVRVALIAAGRLPAAEARAKKMEAEAGLYKGIVRKIRNTLGSEATTDNVIAVLKTEQERRDMEAHAMFEEPAIAQIEPELIGDKMDQVSVPAAPREQRDDQEDTPTL